MNEFKNNKEGKTEELKVGDTPAFKHFFPHASAFSERNRQEKNCAPEARGYRQDPAEGAPNCYARVR